MNGWENTHMHITCTLLYKTAATPGLLESKKQGPTFYDILKWFIWIWEYDMTKTIDIYMYTALLWYTWNTMYSMWDLQHLWPYSCTLIRVPYLAVWRSQIPKPKSLVQGPRDKCVIDWRHMQCQHSENQDVYMYTIHVNDQHNHVVWGTPATQAINPVVV